MTTPPTGDPQPGNTPLSDPENVMWVEEVPDGKLSEEAAYWRMRGMIPPVAVDLEE